MAAARVRCADYLSTARPVREMVRRLHSLYQYDWPTVASDLESICRDFDYADECRGETSAPTEADYAQVSREAAERFLSATAGWRTGDLDRPQSIRLSDWVAWPEQHQAPAPEPAREFLPETRSMFRAWRQRRAARRASR